MFEKFEKFKKLENTLEDASLYPRVHVSLRSFCSVNKRQREKIDQSHLHMTSLALSPYLATNTTITAGAAATIFSSINTPTTTTTFITTTITTRNSQKLTNCKQ